MITLASVCQQFPVIFATLLGTMLGIAAAAADPLDLRPTDWRLSDWRRLNAGEQAVFLAGYSLGWYGLERRSNGTASLASAAKASRLLRAALQDEAVASSTQRVVVALMQLNAIGTLPAVPVSGASWLALPVRHRLALLHGFYAGQYARSLTGALGEEAAAATIEQALDERQFARPRLALGPSLLFARLSDWYFYVDRRVQPLTVSIAEIVDQATDR
jgi:hypothetical protein